MKLIIKAFIALLLLLFILPHSEIDFSVKKPLNTKYTEGCGLEIGI